MLDLSSSQQGLSNDVLSVVTQPGHLQILAIEKGVTLQ